MTYTVSSGTLNSSIPIHKNDINNGSICFNDQYSSHDKLSEPVPWYQTLKSKQQEIMEVVTAGTLVCVKLQSNHFHHRHTNTNIQYNSE